MIESGVVLDRNLNPIYWHLPDGRTAGSIPDTRVLWDVIWDNRDIIGGFAHSHPGSGPPAPSMTDLSTFAAVHQALGRPLKWWITSSDSFLELIYSDTGKPPWGMHSYTTPKGVTHSYLGMIVSPEPPWAQDLRKLSA